MRGGYENEDTQNEMEEVRRKNEAKMRAWIEDERKAQWEAKQKAQERAHGSDAMAPDSKEDRLAMLKELAKLTKPTGASAEGKSLEGADEEE